MSFLLRLFLAVYLQGFIHHQSLADLVDKSSTASNKNILVETEHHPAGPVVRKIWTSPVDDLPYKIEITKLRSGGLLLDGIKLFQENLSGDWYLRRGNRKVQLLIKSQSEKTNKVQLFLKGCNWEIEVTSEHLPKPAVGIATEDEPNLDLILLRTTCK